MVFYVTGIDRRSATYEARESAYRLRGDIREYWRKVSRARAALLTTCNRIEIHGTASDARTAGNLVDGFRKSFLYQFRSAYEIYGRPAVFRHGLRLACGVESHLKGEREIISQLAAWTAGADFPRELRTFWGAIIKKAEKIRAVAGLNRAEVSGVAPLFEEINTGVTASPDRKVLVIGTGRIAGLIASGPERGAAVSFVARKKRKRAARLAKICGGEVLLPADIPRRLVTADAIVCATSSPHYALTGEHFYMVPGLRKTPLYVYDMAMPHDVSPDVRTIPFVRVRGLDDLTEDYMIRNARIGRYAERASRLIQDEVEKLYGRPADEKCRQGGRKAKQARAQTGR